MLHVAIAAAAAAAMTPMVPTSVSTAMAATAIGHIAHAATIAAYTTAVAAVATVTGDGLAVTAQKGDADNREKDRDAKNQCSIHPRILQTGSLA